MTATQRNTRRTATRNGAVKLTQRGIGAVSLSVAVLVALAATGHTGVAALLGYALYLLVSGRGKHVARIVPSARKALRALAWSAVAVAAVMASQAHQDGASGASGPVLGLALAAALATALRLTSRRKR
jgi:hypothetical protein